MMDCALKILLLVVGNVTFYNFHSRNYIIFTGIVDTPSCIFQLLKFCDEINDHVLVFDNFY